MSFKVTPPWVLAGLVLASATTALAVADTGAEDANPYSVISDRNVFHLNPIPPPPPAEDAKPVDLPKVFFTGIMKVGNNVKVLLAIPSKDNKEPATYLSLNEGEKGGDGKGNEVEIVRIRVKQEEVDVLNSGTPQTLTIASNSMAVAAAPAGPAHTGAPPMPGMPGIPNRRIPTPGVLPNRAPTAAAAAPAGGSSIIVGGGNSGGGSLQSYGGQSYGGGAIVTGGYQAAQPVSAGANNTGGQIAGSLLSPASQYQMPAAPTSVPPPEVQAAGLLIHHTANPSGPPLPPGLQQELDGGPPSPP